MMVLRMIPMLLLLATVMPLQVEAQDDPVRIGVDLFSSPRAISVQGEYAYVLYDAGFAVLDVSSPSGPDSLFISPLDGSAADIQARGDFVYISRGTAGLFTYDITNPALPIAVDTLAAQSGFGAIDTMRSRLFIADSTGGIATVSLFESESDPQLQNYYSLAGDPVLDVIAQGDVAYVLTDRAGLIILDVTNFIVTEHSSMTAHGAVDLELSGNLLYVTSGEDGITVIDVTDPKNPIHLEDQGYATSSAVTDMAIIGDYLAVIDGVDNLSLFLDGQIGSGPFLTTSQPSAVNSLGAGGDLLYVLTAYHGTRISQVVEPQGTSILSRLDLVGQGSTAEHVVTSGDTAFVTTTSGGVHIVTIADLADPRVLDVINTRDGANETVLIDSLVYVAEGADGIGIYRRSGGEASRLNLDGSSFAFHYDAPYLYSAQGPGGVAVVDVSLTLSPQIVAVIPVGLEGGSTLKLHGSGDLLAIAEGFAGVQLVDVSTPTAPVSLGQWSGSDVLVDVEFHGSHAYALGLQSGISVLDVTDPESPVLTHTSPIDLPDDRFLNDLGIHNDRVYLSERQLIPPFDDPGEIHILDIRADSLDYRQSISTVGPPFAIAFSGENIFVPEGDLGLGIFGIYADHSVVALSSALPTAEIVAVDGQGTRTLACDASGTVYRFSVLEGLGFERSISLRLGSICGDLVVSGSRAWVVVDDSLVIGLDVSSSSIIEIDDVINIGAVAGGLWTDGTHLYVTARNRGLFIYDVSTPGAAVEIGSYHDEGSSESDLATADPWRVTVDGILAYVATRDLERSVFILTVSDPTDPQLMTTWGDGNARAFDIEIWDNYAFVAQRSEGVLILNVTSPVNPFFFDRLDLPGARRLDVSDGILFVAQRQFGYSLHDVTNIFNPVELFARSTPGTANDIALFDSYIAFSDRTSFELLFQSYANVDEVDPTFEIGVLPNVYLNAYVNLVIAASEVLSDRPVLRFQMGAVDSTLTVWTTGGSQSNIYHSTYRLTEVGDAMVYVNGEDLAGNKAETEKGFTVTIARGASGGTITSEGDSGTAKIEIPPGEETAESAVILSPLTGDNHALPQPPGSGDPSAVYKLSLGRLNRPVELSWERAAANREGRVPVLYTLSGGEWDEVPSQTDLRGDGLTATLPGSSTFLVLMETRTVPAPATAIGLNRPNPFNPQTAIDYSLGQRQRVRLAVHDVRGRLVRLLVDDHVGAGMHSTSWDGRNEAGRDVSSGVYFARLITDGSVQTRKMLLIR